MNTAGEERITTRPGSGRPVVLIVEDEAVVARDLQRSLGDMGYDVLPYASSSEEALAIAAERTPDLVLMDIRIKGHTDGIQTAELLRRRHRVPIVYLTAYADEETVARAAQTQPHGYIIKPFTRREVRSAIEIARYKFAMESKLAERERWFSTTLRSIGDAVVAYDSEQRVQLMNRVAEELTGWTEAEARGRLVSEVVRVVSESNPGEDKPVFNSAHNDRTLRDRIITTLPSNARLFPRSGAAYRIIEDSAAPIIAADGTVLGAVLVFRDITAQKRMQEQVGVSERLSSLGTLAMGVCHEINNPLTFIIGNIHIVDAAIKSWQNELRAHGVRDGVDAEGPLNDLREGAERIRRIVADLSMFGRPIDQSPTVIDVRDTMEWALRVVGAQLRPRARVVRRFEHVPSVLASETRLAQIAINLLVNAVHAIPETDDPTQHSVEVTTSTDAEGRAVIGVRDSGSGIPADVLPFIFDPFFTTKRPGMGTGLGLSICHGIAAALGGEIRVESTVGKGSLFELVLPAAGTAPTKSPAAPKSDPPSHRGRILVIDDEPSLVRAIASVLEGTHDVVATSNPHHGLELLERSMPFDIVLCDVIMPELSGVDFYQRAIARQPQLAAHFAFMTGGAFTPRAVEFLASVSNPCLQKPFDPDALQALVQRMLQADRERRH